MKVLKSIQEMTEWTRAWKRAGKMVALVPTMGALHEGHLKLVDEGLRRADAIVMSIFVNPTQFGKNEDFNKYPRETEDDLKKAKARKVDAVFLPTNEMIYPEGFQTYIEVEGVTKNLCGESRPTHFRGVATVVAKLFNIVSPDVAIFGQKDFQQLVVIKRMVKDLNFPIEIVSYPTVREKDGLAMSSRNKYLSSKERESALSINRSLNAVKELIKGGKKDLSAIENKVKGELKKNGISKIDYVKFVNPETMEDVREYKGRALLAIAVYVGNTRLIDNKLI